MSAASLLPIVVLGVGLALLGELPRRNRSLATDESEIFHGEPGEVKRLSASQRAGLPAEVVVIGEAEAIEYAAPPDSERAGESWRHEFTDRGPFLPRTEKKPLLVADPESGRVDLVGGDVRFHDDAGLWG